MAKKNRRGGRHPLLEQATANTDLRFAPEASALQALLGQATEDYRTDRRTATGTADVAIRGARKSIPQLRRIYNQAASGVKAAQEDVEAAFNQAGVTPDNAFRVVSEAEGTAYRQKMAAETANAAREARRTVHQAQLGKVFALGAARDRYNQTSQQLNQRMTDLIGERQSFLTSELGRLRSERADRRLQEKTARWQYDINPKTGKPYGGGKEPFEKASRDDRKQFSTFVQRALDNAPDLIKAGFGREEVGRMLREGMSDSAAGGPGLGFDKIGDQLAVRAALDMALRGSIAPQTRREMLDMGFLPSQIAGLKFIASRNKRKRLAGRLARERAVTIGQTPLGIGSGKKPGAGSIPVVGDILGLA